MEQQIRFCVAEDGVRLAYATHGRRSPLVKAAIWVTYLEFDWYSPLWRHWWTELGGSHQVVRYDQRGFGLSDHRGEHGFDQGLVDGLGGLTDAVVDLRGRECVQDLQQCRLVKGHRALCPFARTLPWSR